MAKVDISILGKLYQVACDPGEESRVQALGRLVDERAHSIGPATSEAQCLLMVALLLADELAEAKEAGNDQEQGVLVKAVDHLTSRVEQIASRLK